jgi:hypothetical protein
MKTSTVLVVAAVATTLAAPATFAHEAQVPEAKSQAAPAKESGVQLPQAMTHGMRVVRDKQTGKLRAPNADELEAMEVNERAARRARGLPEVPTFEPVVRQHANGMRSAVLGPEYLMTLHGKRRADGTVQQSHSAPKHEQHVVRDERPTE